MVIEFLHAAATPFMSDSFLKATVVRNKDVAIRSSILAAAAHEPKDLRNCIRECIQIVAAGTGSEFSYAADGWQAFLTRHIGDGRGSWGGMAAQLLCARSEFVHSTLTRGPTLPSTLPWGSDEVWRRMDIPSIDDAHAELDALRRTPRGGARANGHARRGQAARG